MADDGIIPSTPAADTPAFPGKDPKTGKFLKGNPGGPGTPYGAKISKFRQALFAEIDEGDLQRVVRAQLSIATDPKHRHCVSAAKLLFEVLSLRVQQIELTAATISPEEASQRIKQFFGLEDGDGK